MSHLVIDGYPIWYETFGHGSNIVLMIPGAIGTAQSDFSTQFDPNNNEECLDQDNFTFICVELPGWGRSCPPERPYGPTLLHDDADRCIKLMEKLGHEKYFVYGWSEGSKVAVIIGRKVGDTRVKALVTQGTVIYASDVCTKRILWSRDIQNWDLEMLRRYERAYGNDIDRVEDLWQRHLDSAIENYGETYPKGLLGPPEEGLQKIKCPTLVLHGERDFFIEQQQAEFMVRHIPRSRLVKFPDGGHNLHQTHPDKFKKTLEKFLLEHV